MVFYGPWNRAVLFLHIVNPIQKLLVDNKQGGDYIV